ncbi:Adenylate cyclase [Diplonema papillatum]|nr:Adenylate cyclase [Diplonema papillatum]
MKAAVAVAALSFAVSMLAGAAGAAICSSGVSFLLSLPTLVLLSLILACSAFLAGTWTITLPAQRVLESLHEMSAGKRYKSGADLKARFALKELRDLRKRVSAMRLSSHLTNQADQAILVDDDYEKLAATETAPRGRVTFVFTDVESAPLLWQMYPEEMQAAVKLHNEVLRAAAAATAGYEVKTMGDDFLFAFASPANAVRFCTESQWNLLNKPWPEALLLDPLCAPIQAKGQLTYRGLRVRMGVHLGDIAAQYDAVTGRIDYFGHNVDIAATIVNSAGGGTIVASKDLVKAVEKDALACSVSALQPVDLKALGSIQLFAIVPNKIRHREPVVAAAVDNPAGGDKAQAGSHRRSTAAPKAIDAHSRAVFLRTLFTGGMLGDSNVKTLIHSLQTSEMVPVTATVAQVRVGHHVGDLASLLATVATVATRNNGLFLRAVSSQATVVWVSKQHAVEAIAFISQLRRERDTAARGISVGVETGGVLFGVTTPADDPVAVCSGATVDLASSLAESAELLNTACLTSSALAARVPRLMKMLRPIDRWPLSTDPGNYIEVLELDVTGLEDNQWNLLYNASTEVEWFDADFVNAVEKARLGDVSQLRAMAAEKPEDLVLLKLLESRGDQICRSAYQPGHSVHAGDEDTAEVLEAWTKKVAGGAMSDVEIVHFNGWAHDVSTFKQSHPGGGLVFQGLAGKDISSYFTGDAASGHKHSRSAHQVLRTLRVYRSGALATSPLNDFLLRDVWTQVKKMGLVQLVGMQLFKNFFHGHSQYAEFFSAGSILASHPMQVLAVIDRVVMDRAANSNALCSMLHSLRRVHTQHKVSFLMFEDFAAAWHITMRGILRERYSSRVMNAWHELFASVADLMTTLKVPSMTAARSAKAVFLRKKTRSASVAVYVFAVNGIDTRSFPPASFVLARLDGCERPYTVYSTSGNEMQLCVKSYPASRTSPVFDALRHGDTLRIRGPFFTEYKYFKGQPLILYGGGTGVVPLLTIASAVVSDGGTVRLVACLRSPDEVFFTQELECIDALQRATGARFQFVQVFTREAEAPAGYPDCIAADSLTAADVDFVGQGMVAPHCVVCGPPRFNASVKKLLLSSGCSATVLESDGEHSDQDARFASVHQMNSPASSSNQSAAFNQLPSVGTRSKASVDDFSEGQRERVEEADETLPLLASVSEPAPQKAAPRYEKDTPMDLHLPGQPARLGSRRDTSAGSLHDLNPPLLQAAAVDKTQMSNPLAR